MARPPPTPRPLADAPAQPRFIFYSHDGLGLGHFQRNLVLARALIDQHPRATILLACAAEGILIAGIRLACPSGRTLSFGGTSR